MRTHVDAPTKGWLLAALCIVALAVCAAQCAPVLKGTFTCENVQVLSDELTLPEAEAYCHYTVRERKKVEGVWGATWSEPIRMHVSSSYRISRALVPGHLGNRGFLEMPVRGVRENTTRLSTFMHPTTIASWPRVWQSTCIRNWRAIRPFPTLERTCGV